jgi:hypothetical protein
MVGVSTGKARVEDLMERMQLTDKEKATLIVDEEDDGREETRWALIGKLLYKKTLHVTTISEALRPA